MAKLALAGINAGRRRLLLVAGGAAATLAAPQISRAQTMNWRIQCAWPARDVFYEFANDYAKRVGALTGERLKLDVVAAGSVVPSFQVSDAVHAGILDGAHGVAALRHNKHRASALFSAPPSFGWDSHGFLAWFYYGGGEALYKEMLNDILKLNLVGFLYFPMPAQPLGWFKKEIKTADDLKGVRYRASDLATDLFTALGATVILLPGGEVVPALERGVLDATDSNNPSSDLQTGLPDVLKVFMTGGHQRGASAFEIVFNKPKFDALPTELKTVLRQAAFSASSDQLWNAYGRYAKDFAEIKKRGVGVARTTPEVLEAQLKAWDKVIAEQSKEPFFAKVIASQKSWVKRIQPYLVANNLDSAELAAAYRHFFG